MAAPNEALKDSLSRAQEITITVTGRTSGRAISLPIWFVWDEGKLYLLPVKGSDTQWYKNVLKNPTMRIEARGAGAEVNAITITDSKQVSSVVEKFRVVVQFELHHYQIPGKVRSQGREEVLFKVRRCHPRAEAMSNTCALISRSIL